MRVSVWLVAVTAVFLLVPVSAIHAADATEGSGDDDYSLTSWEQGQGLPSGRIRAITQDATGYLWLATESGLVRFDGVRFVRWTPDDGSALGEETDGISALCPASDGSLWLGFYAGGVDRIRNGRLERYGKTAGFGRTRVMFVVQDATGAVWAGNQDGIYRFDGAQWKRADARLGLPDAGAFDAYQDSRHNFWIATRRGVYERLAGQSTFTRVDNMVSTVRFSEDSTGRIWVTDPNDGFKTLDDPDTVRRKHPGQGFVIIHDTHDTMWLGTLGRGLWRVRHDDVTKKSTIRRVTVAEGLSSDIVRSVFEDRDGNVWVGTESGLHRFRRRRIATKPGIEYGWAVQSTPDGSVWVATTNGVLQFKGTSQRRYGRSGGLPSSFALSLFVDGRGTLWAGTRQGVARKVGDRFEALPLGNTQLPRVISVAADSRGRVWMVDRELGAFVWENGHLSPLITPEGTSGADVNLVYVDRHDRLWLGFQGATLACIDADGKTKLHTIGDRIGPVLTAVYEDGNGAIWIGGTRGVARISDDHVDVISQPTDLPGQGVFAITGDSRGHIWLGVSSGIIQLALSDFDRAITPSRSRLVYRLYDTSDGLVGVPAHGGFPGATLASNGELWFTTSRGASVITPADLDDRTRPSTLRIEGVHADDRPVSLARGSVLPAGTSRLLFEYTSLNLTSPLKDRFQYKLEGVDTDWVNAGSRREVFYPNLRSGSYRFLVARIADEQGSETSTTTWDFSIQPMYYETWWFIGGCLGLVAIAAWTA
jgi:ligand-binding sensor domain-containing protein